jgi:hypothetical protein
MKSKILATLALLAISILPGCGKSNNSGVAVSGVYGGGYYNNYGTYNGQAMGCYNLTSYLQSNPSGGFQATFAGIGSISQYTGAVAGEMYGSQSGVGGANYIRQNPYGDNAQLSITSAYGNATAVVTLAPATVAAIVYYGGGQLCGIKFNSPR